MPTAFKNRTAIAEKHGGKAIEFRDRRLQRVRSVPTCADGGFAATTKRGRPARRKIRVELSVRTQRRNRRDDADTHILGAGTQRNAVTQRKLFGMIDAHFLERHAVRADFRLVHDKNGFRAASERTGRQPDAGKRAGSSPLIARLAGQQHAAHVAELLVVGHRGGGSIREI